jgi:hypothetical protein
VRSGTKQLRRRGDKSGKTNQARQIRQDKSGKTNQARQIRQDKSGKTNQASTIRIKRQEPYEDEIGASNRADSLAASGASTSTLDENHG